MKAEEFLKKSFDKNVKKLLPELDFYDVKGERGYDWVYEAMEQFARQEVEKALKELEEWCSTPAEHGNSISLFDKIKELKNRQAPSKTT